MCELPAGSENMTFLEYEIYSEVAEAYKCAAMMAKMDESIKWLVLSGSSDSGKTHLAVAVCREWLAQGVAARYAYVPILLDELRQGMNQEQNNYDDRFIAFCNVPLLVLDDLGTEHGTSWAKERLDTIVDYRLMHNLSLIVTTNLDITELPPRIASRLQRYPFGKIIGINAGEYRLRHKV